MQHQKINLTDAEVFEQEIQHKIDAADGSLSVFIVDMRGVNELFSRVGGAASTTFLRSIAKLLVRVCRDGDKVYRIGHCTFGIVLDGIGSPVLQQLAAEKIIRLYNTAVGEMDVSFKAGIHIGIATYPEHAGNAVDLIHSARLAVGAAASSDDPYLIFSVDGLSTLTMKWSLRDDLGKAIEDRSLELVYQPKFCVTSGQPVGAEALVRWEHEDKGPIPPSVFVPLAAEIGMLDKLTSFVLMTALKDASEWPDTEQRYSVAVNIDAHLLKDREINDLTSNSLSIWGDRKVDLIVEITEAALVADSKSGFESLNRLRAAGIGVAIDDFGTGSSSLSYFKNIPATELKIDKSFVGEIDTCDRNRKLVETIITLAHRFDMSVVAEGVERAEELAMLKQMGCDFIQGLYCAEPMSHEEVCRLLVDFDAGRLTGS